MVEITYFPKEWKIEIKGHANFDEMGKDIVCAALSHSFYTLAESLKMLKESNFAEAPVMHDVSDDDVKYIKCVPAPNTASTIQWIYWTHLVGFKALSESYPQNVNFNVVEG